MAELLAQAGDRERAEEVLKYGLTVAETLQDGEGVKTSVLMAMADVFAQAGDRERAEEVLERTLVAAGRIEDLQGRAAALGGMAGVFAGAGDRERAEEVLQGALAAAEELSPAPDRRPDDELDRYALTVAEVARAAAMVGADARVIQVLTAVLDRVVVPLAAADQTPPIYASRPAVGLVAALARLGEAESALVGLGPVNPEQKNAVIADAVKELAEEGKADQAAELAGQALAAGQIAEGGAYGLTDAVGALARAGQPDQALAMAQRIARPEDEAQALAAVTLAFSQAGEACEARLVAERAVRRLSEAGFGSSVALKEVAEMLALAGENDLVARAAEDTLRDLEQAGGQDADLSSFVRPALALAFAWAGEPDRARQAAELARQPGQNIFAGTDLAQAYALIGDLDQAWALANERSWIPSSVFRVLLRKGQPEQLLSLADRSPDPKSRDDVFATAAHALLEAGELDKALTTAQRIKEKAAGIDHQLRPPCPQRHKPTQPNRRLVQGIAHYRAEYQSFCRAAASADSLPSDCENRRARNVVALV